MDGRGSARPAGYGEGGGMIRRKEGWPSRASVHLAQPLLAPLGLSPSCHKGHTCAAERCLRKAFPTSPFP